MALKSGVVVGGGLMGPIYSPPPSPFPIVFGLGLNNCNSIRCCCCCCCISNQQQQQQQAFGALRLNRFCSRNVNPLIVRAHNNNNNTNTNNTSPPPPPPPDYLPDANFYKIEAILRPWRIPQVSSALLKMGIRGVTVSDVRGFGAQGGLTERQAGSEFSEDKFLAKVKMEIVVCKDQVEAVIDKIIEVARTGEIGDGKIFLLPVTDVIRVRTGERGEKAERMVGGRSDISSAAEN